jgi:hypothetical protein
MIAVSAVVSSAFTSQMVTSDLAQSATTAVPTCIQGQLQVAMEQLGGGGTREVFGYTFVVLNTGTHECAVRGYPWWVVFANNHGQTVTTVSITHRPTSLYGQPKASKVILRSRQAATFGLSFQYKTPPPTSVAAACLADLVDFRLPANAAHEFSYEFPVHIDVCDAGRSVSVTPIEGRTVPLV